MHFRFNTTSNANHQTNQSSSSSSSSSSSIPIPIEKLVQQRCKSGSLNLDEALDLFKRLLQNRSLTSVIPFNQLLAAIAKLKTPHHYKTVISLFKTMNSYRIQPDIYTFNILINSSCQLGWSQILRHGLEPDSVTFTALLNEIFMKGKPTQALKLFNTVFNNGYSFSNHITFGIMINGLCKATNTDTALSLVRDLEKRDLKPDGRTSV
ncbi:Pentatricopeptide repeat-containing protein [Thalictrum thalictroides]|uniref:Pentatricopeptide repeat-containing protein n=1 Tax=Thalictrum thalictroides TaxID=46969 RepID=A0A7J6USW5_THATH|nr:Pentatricopeptide repeat-containing protein [Thalictrum thalictroides]